VIATILATVAVLALLGLTASNVFVARVVLRPRIDPQPTPAPPQNPSVTFENMRNLERRLDDFEIAVSEGIARVTRHEKRIQKTVTSARRLVREAGLEHAGIEAEYAELRDGDGEGIEPLPAMPEEVEAVRVVRFPGGSLEIGAA